MIINLSKPEYVDIIYNPELDAFEFRGKYKGIPFTIALTFNQSHGFFKQFFHPCREFSWNSKDALERVEKWKSKHKDWWKEKAIREKKEASEKYGTGVRVMMTD